MALGDRIEVVAHRGASAEEPEHTLAAYLRALDEGAEAVECDVRLTSDGHLVLVHDRRINRTSTGSGSVSRKTLKELSEFDYSAKDSIWHDAEEPLFMDQERRSVLTLQRLLETLRDYYRTVGISIETKHPTRFGGYVELELAEMLKRFGLDTPNNAPASVRVMSFSQIALRRSMKRLPALPAVLLTDDVPRRYRDGSLPKGVTISGTSVETIRSDPEYVRRCHDHGHVVHVWTVDAPEDITRCIELGVDAIISNRPGLVLGMLGR